MIKTPRFWYKSKAGILSKALTPVSCVYEKLSMKYADAKSLDAYKSKLPVLCVGNITAGGGGKTPTTLAFYRLLRDSAISVNPYILTRGYGGVIKGPERVPSYTGIAENWGDEALLMAQYAPVIKSVNRAKGAKYIEKSDADFIIMDDGAQNYDLEKDLIFYIINGRYGLGNKHFIPSGPLRENLEKGFEKASAFIIAGEDETHCRDILPKDKPCFETELCPAPISQPEKGIGYMAFAGIALPQNFKKTLNDCGYHIEKYKIFGDHHRYTPRDIEELFKEASTKDLKLITTEKDFMRLPPFARKKEIGVLKVEMRFKNEEKIISFLKNHPALEKFR